MVRQNGVSDQRREQHVRIRHKRTPDNGRVSKAGSEKVWRSESLILTSCSVKHCSVFPSEDLWS